MDSLTASLAFWPFLIYTTEITWLCQVYTAIIIEVQLSLVYLLFSNNYCFHKVTYVCLHLQKSGM